MNQKDLMKIDANVDNQINRMKRFVEKNPLKPSETPKISQ